MFFTLPSTYSTEALVLHWKQICIKEYHIWIQVQYITLQVHERYINCWWHRKERHIYITKFDLLFEKELHQTFWSLWCNFETIFSFPFHQIAWNYWEKLLALLQSHAKGWSACHFKGKFPIFSCRVTKFFLLLFTSM